MKDNFKMHFDEEGDFLELRIGNPMPSYYEEISDGIFERIDEKSKEIIGVAIFNFKKRKIRIDYNKETDSAYLYIKYPIEDAETKKTIELNENIIIDLDKNNKIMGIEILNAKRILNDILHAMNGVVSNRSVNHF